MRTPEQLLYYKNNPRDPNKNICRLILNKIKSLSYWTLCLFAVGSVSRNFAGGDAFIKRTLGEVIPYKTNLVFGIGVGGLTAFSPLKQVRNSIDKVCIALQKPGAFKSLFLIGSSFGITAGFAFAEMGTTAFDSMVSDWGFGDIPMVIKISQAIFAMTFLAQSVLYTEKVYSLKFGIVLKAIRHKPAKILPLLLNAAGSCLTVTTNQKYGAMAAKDFLNTPDMFNQILGGISAFGPGIMCFVDTTIMFEKIVKTHSPSVNENLSDEKYAFSINSQNYRPLGNDEDTESPSPEDEFSFSSLGGRKILFAFVMAAISALPNVEYNLTVNFTGCNFWSILLLSVGTFYNVIPKFVSSMESACRELKKPLIETPVIPSLNGHTHLLMASHEDHSSALSISVGPALGIS